MAGPCYPWGALMDQMEMWRVQTHAMQCPDSLGAVWKGLHRMISTRVLRIAHLTTIFHFQTMEGPCYPWGALMDQIEMWRVQTHPMQCPDSLGAAWKGLHRIISTRVLRIAHLTTIFHCMTMEGPCYPWGALMDQIKMWRVQTHPMQCVLTVWELYGKACTG